MQQSGDDKDPTEVVVAPEVVTKYTRLDKPVVSKRGARKIWNRKLRSHLEGAREEQEAAALSAAKAEILLPTQAGCIETEGMERTFKVTQKQIRESVDIQSAAKSFSLQLDQLGPYVAEYTRNGRYMLLGGARGHVAMIDWPKKKIQTEVQVGERVRDVTFLHNHRTFAVAQKAGVAIYDGKGVELHYLKDHVKPTRLQYLPYHWLLASCGESGYVKYQDMSTGAMVAAYRTRMGACRVMRMNPWNGIMCLGHARGQVTMWSPTSGKPLVQMLCHKGPLTSIAVDRGGNYMVTAGADRTVKVWDVRTYKEVHSYYARQAVSSLDISQTRMLSVCWGSHVQVWKDALATKAAHPYMNHLTPASRILRARFCPFEDVLAVGHAKGLDSLLIPGSGEANFDSYANNPYETKAQRREGEVLSLLDKLQPDMITLDTTLVGRISRTPQADIDAKRAAAEEANQDAPKWKPKHKMKGRSRAGRHESRKQLAVWAERRKRFEEQREAKAAEERNRTKRKKSANNRRDGGNDVAVPASLKRFRRKQ